MSNGPDSVAVSVAGARFGSAIRGWRFVDLLISAAVAMLRNALARRRRRQTERELLALSDDALKDIGVSRSEIWYVAHRPWLGARRRGHAQD